jgi:predicted nucleic acid-binding protein
VQIPARVFLDTNVVNLLVKHRETIFELGQMPSTLADARTNEIEALTHIFQVGQRANWDLVASAKTIEEISRTQDPGVRDDLLDYVRGLVEIDTEDSKHAASLGRRLMDASIVSILRDRSDRELLGNAIGLGCDAFCTCDHKTIVDKRDLLPKLPLRILTPVEWWKHIKPWAGLWC